MNGTLKVAALAALFSSAAAFAQDPSQTAQPETRPPAADDTSMATEAQWPKFEELDKNGDGAISEEEARAQSLIASRFGEIDADRNGTLSAEEYGKVRQKSEAPNP